MVAIDETANTNIFTNFFFFLRGKALQEYLKNHGEDAAFLKLPEVEELNELYKIVTLKSQTKQADLLVFANTLKKEKVSV